MSQITRREKDTQEAMQIVGSIDNLHWMEKTYEGYNWRCDGCGLVWPKKHQAASCESRKHVTSFKQSYGGYVENGIHRGGTHYIRQAIRREKVEKKEVA